MHINLRASIDLYFAVTNDRV